MWYTHVQWPLPDQSSINIPNCSENLPTCSDTILTFKIHNDKWWSFTAQLNCCVTYHLLLDALHLMCDHLTWRWLVLTLSSHAPPRHSHVIHLNHTPPQLSLCYHKKYESIYPFSHTLFFTTKRLCFSQFYVPFWNGRRSKLDKVFKMWVQNRFTHTHNNVFYFILRSFPSNSFHSRWVFGLFCFAAELTI